MIANISLANSTLLDLKKSADTGDAIPENLLEEINSFNKNPSKEMIELRDWFIKLLKSIPA